MVDRHDVREAPGRKALHTSVRLIDGVPAQALLNAPDRLKAHPGVELESSVDVTAGDDDLAQLAIRGGLDKDTAGEPEAWLSLEPRQHRLQIVRRELDVTIELHEVGKFIEVDQPQGGIEVRGLDRQGKAVRPANARSGLGHREKGDFRLEHLEKLQRAIG